MSTWEKTSLSGVPERSARGDGPPRADVRERVLDVAQELVNANGLTVGLGHLSFEEVIGRAGVSRTTAYRVWPRKERFLEDLLRRLADTSSPCYGGAVDERQAALAQSVIAARLEDLRTVDGRRALVVEICRVVGDDGFTATTASPGWLTFVAMIATMRSLGDADLAKELRDRMQAVEGEAAANSTELYQGLGAILGYRARQVPGGYATLSQVGTAVLHGMLTLADIRPSISVSLGVCDPFDTGTAAEWSAPALGYASILLGLLEPDPDYDPESVIQALSQAAD